MAKRKFIHELLENGTSEFAPRTLVEHVYLQLRNAIIEGDFPSDAKLRIAPLSARYGVSSGTIREALTRLVSDHLVVPEGQRGFRVAPMSFEDFADLTQLRLQLELPALRRSIALGTTEWKSQLTEVFVQLSHLERPLDPLYRHQWEALNARFHELLIQPAASPWTLRLWRLLARHGERYRHFSLTHPASKTRNVHEEHAAIYHAAMAGDDLKAALWLEAHVKATLEVLRQGLAAPRDVEDKGKKEEADNTGLLPRVEHSAAIPPTSWRQPPAIALW